MDDKNLWLTIPFPSLWLASPISKRVYVRVQAVQNHHHCTESAKTITKIDLTEGNASLDASLVIGRFRYIFGLNVCDDDDETRK